MAAEIRVYLAIAISYNQRSATFRPDPMTALGASEDPLAIFECNNFHGLICGLSHVRRFVVTEFGSPFSSCLLSSGDPVLQTTDTANQNATNAIGTPMTTKSGNAIRIVIVHRFIMQTRGFLFRVRYE